jgi:hypothetical protein
MSFRPIKPREYGSTKQIVGALFAEVGGVKEAAFVLGRGVSQTYAYADEQVADAQISFDAVRRLSHYRLGATAAAEALAFDAGGFFTPIAPSDESLAELMAREEAQHGAMLADLMRRIGALGEGGDARLLEHLDALISALVAARRKAAP